MNILRSIVAIAAVLVLTTPTGADFAGPWIGRERDLDNIASPVGYILKPMKDAAKFPGAVKAIPVLGLIFNPGDIFRDCANCPEMVVIPAGSFIMGSPSHEKSRDRDEGPQHYVQIDDKFAVGKYEVTQAEWRAVMGNNPSRFMHDRNPVEEVSWDDAQDFVKRLSVQTNQTYRLLTEAEWEYAARATTTTPFHTGDRISTSQANFNGNYTHNGSSKGRYQIRPIAVGHFSPNRFGLHDMHGNVLEWVEDCYHKNAYSNHDQYPRAVGNRHDVCVRVLRGGSWIDSPRDLRSSYRCWISQVYKNLNVGFRIARALNP